MDVLSLLLLGSDSAIACTAIGPLVGRRRRLPLAAVFGVADGLGFLLGSLVHWHLPEAITGYSASVLLCLYGGYVLTVAAATRRDVVRWPIWLLPWAMSLDNVSYGLLNHSSTVSALGRAGVQTLSSAGLALAGLMVALALTRVHRRAADAVGGGALVVGAALLLLA